ncbi:hypothetical protein AMTRI_Chr04g186190 [Amborella trichopoda]
METIMIEFLELNAILSECRQQRIFRTMIWRYLSMGPLPNWFYSSNEMVLGVCTFILCVFADKSQRETATSLISEGRQFSLFKAKQMEGRVVYCILGSPSFISNMRSRLIHFLF